MTSGPVDHAKHPADPSGPPPSAWIRILRVAISLVILWCLWLIYPLASVRICAARVASYYEPVIDPVTGQITHYVQRRGGNANTIRGREEDLVSQPIPRLLSLLPSRDPIGIWVISQAIEHQLREGRLVGWPGKRERVPPLDAESTELILQVLDQDLPPPAAANLVKLLMLVPSDLPQYQELLLKAVGNREPLARAFGIRVLDFVELDTNRSFELLEKLADDSDSRVRADLVAFLASWSRRTEPKELPRKYQQVLVAASEDEAKEVRLAAAEGIAFMDLDSAEVSEAVVSLLNDSEESVRRSAFRALSAQSASGRVPQFPSNIVDALLEWPTNLSGFYRHEYVFDVLSITGIPAERQWQLIEAELTRYNPQNGYYDLRVGLFSPTEPKHFRPPEKVNWKQFCERFRPYAAAAKPRLIEWATEAVKSEDEATAVAGVQFLGEAAPEAPNRVAPALVHISRIVRDAALCAIVPTPEQLPRILELMDDPVAGNQGNASYALVKCVGPFSSEQIDQLVATLRREQNWWVLGHISTVLEAHAPPGLDLKDLWLDSLTNDSQDTRNRAVNVLIRLGARAHGALPQVLEGIRAGRLGPNAVEFVIATGRPIESAEDVRRMIQLLLEVSGPPGAWPIAFDKKPHVLRDLMKLCPSEFASSILADELVTSLGTADEQSREPTAKILSEASIDPDVLIPKLGKLLQARRWEARQGAAFALAHLGPQAASASELLIERLGDSELQVRIAAASALGAIGPGAGTDAAAAMAQMAKQDKVPGGQFAALAALEKMGPHIPTHMATLESLSKQGDLMVRKAATRVLDRQKARNEP